MSQNILFQQSSSISEKTCYHYTPPKAFPKYPILLSTILILSVNFIIVSHLNLDAPIVIFDRKSRKKCGLHIFPAFHQLSYVILISV